MDVRPDDAVLDELIKRRLDEILPQKIEEKLAELKAAKPGSMTIIATKGTLDWAYPPFILSSTAAALGWDVSVFFTFYGLQLLRKDISHLKVSPLGNPGMPMKMPFGPEWFRHLNWNIPNAVQAGRAGIRVDGDLAHEADDQEQGRRGDRRAAGPLHRGGREPDRLPDDGRPLRLRRTATSSRRSRNTSAPRRSCRWRATRT